MDSSTEGSPPNQVLQTLASRWQLFIAGGLAIIAAGLWLRVLGRDEDESGATYQPAEVEYTAFMAAELELLGLELTETGHLLQQPEMSSSAWRADVARQAEAVSASAHRIESRQGTGRFKETNRIIGQAMSKYIDAMALVGSGLSSEDERLIDRAFAETLEAGELLSHASAGAH